MQNLKQFIWIDKFTFQKIQIHHFRKSELAITLTVKNLAIANMRRCY